MYGSKKIYPIDTTPSVAVGVSIPFNGPSVFKSTYTTQDAIKNNLINFFLTNKRERYLNNNFGGNLRKYIFEQIVDNNLDFMKSDIQSQISTYFFNINIIEFEINKTNENEITIFLKYNINNTGISDFINISLI